MIFATMLSLQMTPAVKRKIIKADISVVSSKNLPPRMKEIGWKCHIGHDRRWVLRPVVVVAADSRGRIVAISQLSPAAAQSGLTREAVLGRQLWEFGTDLTKEMFSQCRLDARDIHYVAQTNAGAPEVWEAHMLHCAAPAEVVLIGTLISRPPEVTPNQASIIQGLADDLTPDQIALEQGVSSGTIHTQLGRLRLRFHVATNAGLVGIACRHGVAK